MIFHTKVHYPGNNLEIQVFYRKKGYHQCKSKSVTSSFVFGYHALFAVYTL